MSAAARRRARLASARGPRHSGGHPPEPTRARSRKAKMCQAPENGVLPASVVAVWERLTDGRSHGAVGKPWMDVAAFFLCCRLPPAGMGMTGGGDVMACDDAMRMRPDGDRTGWDGPGVEQRRQEWRTTRRGDETRGEEEGSGRAGGRRADGGLPGVGGVTLAVIGTRRAVAWLPNAGDDDEVVAARREWGEEAEGSALVGGRGRTAARPGAGWPVSNFHLTLEASAQAGEGEGEGATRQQTVCPRSRGGGKGGGGGGGGRPREQGKRKRGKKQGGRPGGLRARTRAPQASKQPKPRRTTCARAVFNAGGLSSAAVDG